MDVYGYYMRVPMCLWTPGRACLIKLELVADWYRKRLRMIRVWECGNVAHGARWCEARTAVQASQDCDKHMFYFIFKMD